ncbi:MAG: Gfo/Idh/MocA family oxidoreductase [Candidatus Dormiibacterota bacterium]
MESKLVRILVVGHGVRGKHWTQAIKESASASLFGIVEPRVVGEGDSRVYPSLEAVPEGIRPDVVVIASPPTNHGEAVNWAVTRGIPILCEKPLSDDFAESVALVEAAESAGVPLSIGMNFRYVPAAGEVRRLVQERSLGELLFGTFTYITNRDGRHPDLNDYPLFMDNPMLVDQSIHHLDLIRYGYATDVSRVTATNWNPKGSVYRSNSCSAVIMELGTGQTVTYVGTWTSGSRRMEYRWRTDFESGVAVQSDPFGDLWVSEKEPGMFRTARPDEVEIEPFMPRGFESLEPFHGETARLLMQLVRQSQSLSYELPTGRDHLATLALLEAVKRAEASRKWVAVTSTAV